jgi:hypothetical protein
MAKEIIHVFKADPVGDQDIPDVILDFSGNITTITKNEMSLRDVAVAYEIEADKIMQGIGVCPQGTRHALLIALLEHSLNLMVRA